MQAGRHAMTWGLSRLAIVLGLTAAVAILAYVVLVFVVVAVQSAGALGQ
jgi:type IV secretory pathway VirB3-like protein